MGGRGYWPDPAVVAWRAEQGLGSVLLSEIGGRGLHDGVNDAVQACTDAGTKGVFISVEVEVVDPAFAPGTGTPEPGGITSRELLDTVRRIAKELPVLGVDIVEVSPPYDGPGQITAFMANRVVLEVLNGMAKRKLAAQA